MLWLIFCWVVGFIAIGLGFYTTKEVHKEKGVFDYISAPSFSNISSDSYIGWILGAVFSVIGNIILGIFVGLFLKILPWWLVRGIHFAVGIGFFVLGFYLSQDNL